jgi:hypothetical protein
LGLKVRPGRDTKLNNFDIYSFTEFLVFKNEKRIYIYHLSNVGKYKKVYKIDETHGVTTYLVAYFGNTFMFGNNKGELKRLSFTEKLFNTKTKIHATKITAIYCHNNKFIISSNSFGVIKFSDYYTLYTSASINTYLQNSKILCTPDNKLAILNTEKGFIYKEHNNSDSESESYCDRCEGKKDKMEEYYDKSSILTWDLKEKDSFSTCFKINEAIIYFITINKDNYITASANSVYLWHRNKLKATKVITGGIYFLKKLNDSMFMVFSQCKILVYKGTKQFKEIKCYFNLNDPVKILDDESFIYQDSFSLFYFNINCKKSATFVDKNIRFDGMVYVQGKVFYLKEKTLFCFNTQTLRSFQLKKGGSILDFYLKDLNTICFETKDCVYEFDVGSMQVIGQGNNLNKIVKK